MFRFAAALVVLGLVAAPLHAADKTMTAKGTVKTVAADSLTITDSAGKDWTFKVDTNTKVVASGGSHKTADTKAMGKTPLITDEVKAGAASASMHQAHTSVPLERAQIPYLPGGSHPAATTLLPATLCEHLSRRHGLV